MIAQTHSAWLRQATPAALRERYKRIGPGGLYKKTYTTNLSPSLSLSLDRILQHKIDGFADSCFMSWQTERGVPGAPCLIMGSSWMYTPHFLTSSAARAQKSCLATTCSRVLCVFVCVMQYLSQNEAKSKSWRKLLVLPR